MIWLMNTYDPERDDARWHLAVPINRVREDAWREHRVWLGSKIIGLPKATVLHTASEWEEMGYVGVYRP